MLNKQYPYPKRWPVYTGQTLQTGPNSYIISIGVEGSEVPLLGGELVETGPFTSREGIAAWITDEYNRLSGLGGTVIGHINNAAALQAALEEIIGENGVTLNLQSGQFSPRSGALELREPKADS